MRDFARPDVVVSRCLGFDACRYNGQTIPSRFTEALREHAEIRTVCPEVEIGLGTPRDTIRIVRIDDALRLEQPATGRDLTDEMAAYSEALLDGLPAVDGFVLKSRSPSCGVRDAKIMAPVPKGPTLGRGPGFFAAAVLDRYPLAAVEDEGRLTNWRIREHFLTRLFACADFRRARRGRSMAKLVDFHARHKLLLMATNQREMRVLGSIVGNLDRKPLKEVWALYAEHLEKALARPARYPSHVNVLMHALGHFKKRLGAREKANFLDELARYREGRIPLSVMLGILRSFIVRFDVEYLDRQVYFEPYPEDLVEITDSGKGRGK